MKDADLLNVRLGKLQQDYEQQMMSSETLAGENSEKLAQLRVSVLTMGYTTGVLCTDERRRGV